MTVAGDAGGPVGSVEAVPGVSWGRFMAGGDSVDGVPALDILNGICGVCILLPGVVM